MSKQIIKELKRHAPFTIFGAVTGIIIMIIFRKIPPKASYNIFYTLHPIHIVLSALVTAAMFKLHKDKPKLWMVVLVGYFGTIGIATLSDSVIPYLGETLLRLPRRELHIGFIEKWWLVNPLALLGIAIACLWPKTKFPHAGHVLLSTWASLFHMTMALGEELSVFTMVLIAVFLFLAVWVPCCASDIIFPLLFAKGKVESAPHA